MSDIKYQGTKGAGRTIIHLDMDAFYASVEQRDNPSLQGRPVIVGGSARRGVVSAASYEARRFGVRSAMPVSRALQLCPRAVHLPVRMDAYRGISQQVFAIFARFTDLIEPLSIDEAFLDVTGSERLFGPAGEIAARIRREVCNEIGLTISAGVAPNKFLAKLASEAAKPDGLMEIEPDKVDSFLLPLPVSALWGVGKVTRDGLERLGIYTVRDLRRFDLAKLEKRFGATGAHLFRLARGQDERAVTPESAIKSVGHEDTYATDLGSEAEIDRQFLHLAEKVAARLRRRNLQGRCISIKVRFSDFQTLTRSRTLKSATDHAGDLYQVARELMAEKDIRIGPVRLLGISVSTLTEKGQGQQDLFAAEEKERLADLDKAVDGLRARFGETGVRRATLLEPEGNSGREFPQGGKRGD